VTPSQAFLVLGDEPGTARALASALPGWRGVSQPVAAPDLADAGAGEVGVIFVAVVEPEARTHGLLRELRARLPHAPVVLLGADASGYSAALRVGAFDFLRTPLEPDAVRMAVHRTLEWRRLDLARQQLERAVSRLRIRARETDERDASASPCQALQCAVRERLSLRELEDRYVDSILALTGGNKVRAAEILGIDRRTLYRRGR
jgi:DNA-binding NtrC family response regulator